MDFVLCPRATVFFLFLTNVQCHIIKKLTDFDCSGCMGKYQTSVLLYIDLAIAHSIQQDPGLIFLRTALTLSQ